MLLLKNQFFVTKKIYTIGRYLYFAAVLLVQPLDICINKH